MPAPGHLTAITDASHIATRAASEQDCYFIVCFTLAPNAAASRATIKTLFPLRWPSFAMERGQIGNRIVRILNVDSGLVQ